MTALGVDHRLGSDGAPALGTALVTARHLLDLTESEIGERMQRSFRLAGKRAEIENLSRRVSLAITKWLSPVEKAD
jgi:hypothetical protein